MLICNYIQNNTKWALSYQGSFLMGWWEWYARERTVFLIIISSVIKTFAFCPFAFGDLLSISDIYYIIYYINNR